MGRTNIEWTNETWNPVRGCSRVSSGCDNCYAIRQAHRFNTPHPKSPYHGLTTIRRGKVDWTGKARLVPEQLSVPLHWRKPRRVFVNSMSDLFHESLSNKEIAAVFSVMAACPQHTFQVLTKRPERALKWFKWATDWYDGLNTIEQFLDRNGQIEARWLANDTSSRPWPLPNVWLGVSAENQKTADERIPLLLQCPAAIRFVSAEPLLGSIKLTRWLWGNRCPDPQCGDSTWDHDCELGEQRLHWVIAGGESGTGARPFDIAWARAFRDQCQEAGVPFFMKQLGSMLVLSMEPTGSFRSYNGKRQYEVIANKLSLSDRKGGDMSEWPEDLRVREFPA